MNKKERDTLKKLADFCKRIYRMYGLTYQDYLILLNKQGRKCAVCLKLYPRMCIDHIHVKGFKKMKPEEKRKYVRGIVCFLCNVGFKTFDRTLDGKINRQRLNGTYDYFKEYKLKGEL